MAIERQYTDPLQVVDTPVMAERLTHVADVRKVSRARVIRELLAAGIAQAEQAAGIADGEVRAERVVAERAERLAETG